MTDDGSERDEIEARTPLVLLPRGPLGLTGTHVGCNTTNCEACTVLIDGEPVTSCTILAVRAEGSADHVGGTGRRRGAGPVAGGLPAVPRPAVRLLPPAGAEVTP